jgi:hypothetical protein
MRGMDDFEIALQLPAPRAPAADLLREALHAYAVAAEAAGKRLSGRELALHVCHPRQCPFVAATQELFVCAVSGNQHRCTVHACKSLERVSDGLVCPISGYSFDSLPLLTDGDNHRFGGNAQLSAASGGGGDVSAAAAAAAAADAVPIVDGNAVFYGRVGDKSHHMDMDMEQPDMDCEAEILAAMTGDAAEEKVRETPFSSQKERSLLQRDKEQRKLLNEATELLELLLFSPERVALNAKMQTHTRDKNTKAVANYLRSTTPQTPPAFVNILQIVACDRRDFKWCLETPIRGSPVHLECLNVCQEACIWWHRFIADNDGRLLPNYTFLGHALAVLYIYAAGLQQYDRTIMASSAALQSVLPGNEKLQGSFASLEACHFTRHERICRERMLAWVHRHAPPPKAEP